MSTDIISGVGARYGAVFNLDQTTGLPLPGSASATPVQGTLVEGIKTVTANDPTPRNITHFGEDRAYAQDTLPATEAGSFQFTTSKTNLVLDAMIEGGTTYTINSNVFLAGNTDNRGSEPQIMLHFYRQALDTKKGSSTFGKLRQWHNRIYPSARVSRQTQSMEGENTDVTYNATPTPVSLTPWNEVFNETNWAVVEAEYIEFVTDQQARLNMYRGDGTLTEFELSHPPLNSSAITVWVDGTQTAPSSVDTSTANPAFTMGSAPGNNLLTLALIETSEPGTT